jgi:hypothetical protein
MRNDRRRHGVALTVLALALLGCGGRLPSRATPSLAAHAPGSSPPSEPIDRPFVGALPGSTEFAGATFTVTGAQVTNVHPYTMFGEPKPGDMLFGLLTVEAANTGMTELDYGFDDDVFTLQTWGGAELAVVPKPGVRPFSRLEPGQRETDVVVFGLPAIDTLDGAALLIGRSPDQRAMVRLSSETVAPAFPAGLAVVGRSTMHAGSLDWTILDGLASLDAPAGVCCPETGLRADDGELFISLALEATVVGSPYGQASVTSDQVRLVVDGAELEPLDFDGQAGVPEGRSFRFTGHWLVNGDGTTLALRVGVGESETVDIPLAIAETGS